jgi:hypothetical protein
VLLNRAVFCQKKNRKRNTKTCKSNKEAWIRRECGLELKSKKDWMKEVVDGCKDEEICCHDNYQYGSNEEAI